MNQFGKPRQSLEDQIRFAKDEVTKVTETNAYTTSLLGHKDSEIRKLRSELDRLKDRVTELEARLAASSYSARPVVRAVEECEGNP